MNPRPRLVGTNSVRLALRGAFTIFYFIGRVETQPDNYAVAPTLAGISHVFAAFLSEACDNCGRQEEQAVVITNTPPVTSKLMNYVESEELVSLRLDDVKSCLIKN